MINFTAEIKKLLKEGNLTEKDISKLESKDEYKIDAFFKAMDYVQSFSKEIVYPLTQSLINANDKEKYLINTYYRLYCIILSILKLNQVKYFQTIAASVRSLFELYLDLILLIEEILENTIPKYLNFKLVQKYKTAQKITRFYENHPTYKFNVLPHKEFINNNKGEINNIVLKLWGKTKINKPNFPDHWSGISTLGRAQKIDKYLGNNDLEELYTQIFPHFSWYVHSDPTGTLGLDKDYFNHLVGIAYVHSHNIYLKAIVEYCKFFHIEKTINNFPKIIENIKNSPGFFILERKIKGKVSDIKYGKNS